MGRPSHKPLVRYQSFLYRAASWNRARRVVAKVEFHFGELFPRVGFIVTNLVASSRAVVRFYNKRGTAEQWIKEGKQAVKMTRLSLPPLPRQRGAAVAEPDRLQPQQFVAAAGAADEGRHLVADQLAAAVGENRRAVHQTCALLLVAVGREASDAAAVCWHAAEDRGAAVAGGIRRAQSGSRFR